MSSLRIDICIALNNPLFLGSRFMSRNHHPLPIRISTSHIRYYSRFSGTKPTSLIPTAAMHSRSLATVTDTYLLPPFSDPNRKNPRINLDSGPPTSMSAATAKSSPRPVRPTAKNIYSRPLKLHSLSPPTGFFRDGFCDTDVSDVGNHTVAAILTEPFLKFTQERGNNLSAVPGLKAGCGWCLCAARWKEVYDAYKRGEVERQAVPSVDLAATHLRALNAVRIEELREFAVKDEEGGRKDVDGVPGTEKPPV